MPRKLRVEYPGAIYHVMSRDDRCEKIFIDDVDRQDFLKTLAEACQKTSWQVHASRLMKTVSTFQNSPSDGKGEHIWQQGRAASPLALSIGWRGKISLAGRAPPHP